MEQIRIIKEMHKEYGTVYPRFMVWENVPGALSSNKGEDFRIVLEETAKIAEPDTVIPGPPKGKWRNSGCIVGDGWSIAWRILDAQFWGVPQRRRRIALVADLAGGSAGKILFESEGVSGYTPQGFRSWQGTSGTSENGFGAAGCVCLNDQGGNRMDVMDGVTCTLRAEAHHPPCVMESAGFCTEPSAHSRSIGYEEETSPTLRAGTVPAAVVLENHPADSRIAISEDNTVQTLTSRMETGGNNVPLVMKIRSSCEGGGKGALIQDNKSDTLGCNNDQTVFVPKAYGICSKQSHSMLSDNPKSGFYEADTSRCLDANGGNPSCNQGGMAVVAVQGPMIGRSDKNDPQGSGVNEDVSFTLDATDRHAVAYGIDRATYNMGKNVKFGITVEKEVEPTMVSKEPGAVGQPIYYSSKSSFHANFTDDDVMETLLATDFKDPPTVSKEPDYIIRRLTPTECERLQGFPDGWTDIGDYIDSNGKKKKSSDTARYKALGNSIALPPWRWVLSRLCRQCKTPATMGSLFDGIGGFPLIWEEINGKGSCLWASEIEEFPIAVTKIRFSE